MPVVWSLHVVVSVFPDGSVPVSCMSDTYLARLIRTNVPQCCRQRHSGELSVPSGRSVSVASSDGGVAGRVVPEPDPLPVVLKPSNDFKIT